MCVFYFFNHFIVLGKGSGPDYVTSGKVVENNELLRFDLRVRSKICTQCRFSSVGRTSVSKTEGRRFESFNLRKS